MSQANTRESHLEAHLLTRGTSLVLGVVLALVAAGLAWAQRYGFDLLDGALYLLQYEQPAETRDTHTSFHLIGRMVWLSVGGNLVLFRLFTLALVGCGVAWAARELARKFSLGQNTAWIVITAVLVALASVTWVPVALTYNSLSLLFGAVVLGTWAKWDVLHRPVAAPSSLVWLGLTTLGGLVLFLCKPPAGLIHFVLIVSLALSSPSVGRKLKAGLAGLGAGGLALLSLLGWMATHSDAGWLARFANLRFAFQTDWLLAQTTRYTDEFTPFLGALGRDLWIPGLVVALTLAWRVATRSAETVRFWGTQLLLGSVVASLGYVAWNRELWDGSFQKAVSGEASRFHLVIFSASALLGLGAWGSRGQRTGARSSFHGAVWFMGLLLAPLLSSFGTTNPLYLNALYHAWYWTLLSLWGAVVVARRWQARWFPPAMALLIAAGAVGHIYTGHLAKPYMFEPPLWTQTQEVAVGASGVRVHVRPETAAFFEETRNLLTTAGFRVGDDVFGFFNLPGVVYAIGGVSPGAPWYFGKWFHDDRSENHKILAVPEERRRRAWILAQPEVRDLAPYFAEVGLNFPEGYRLVGAVTNAANGQVLELWKPQARE